MNSDSNLGSLRGPGHDFAADDLEFIVIPEVHLLGRNPGGCHDLSKCRMGLNDADTFKLNFELGPFPQQVVKLLLPHISRPSLLKDRTELSESFRVASASADQLTPVLKTLAEPARPVPFEVQNDRAPATPGTQHERPFIPRSGFEGIKREF